jgi:hypothetical protein
VAVCENESLKLENRDIRLALASLQHKSIELSVGLEKIS